MEQPVDNRRWLIISTLIVVIGAGLFFITGSQATLFLILPFALAGALSPVMLTQQTLLLTTRQGLRAAAHYALGAALVLFLFVLSLIFFGQVISLPHEPTLSRQADIILGLGLVLLAAILLITARRRPEPEAERASPRPRSFSPISSLGFGSFSMATNFTTLALMLPAAKLIATADHRILERLMLASVLIIIATTPAWLPPTLARLAPGQANPFLARLGNLIQRYGLKIVIGALFLLGLFLLAKGLSGL